MICSGKWDVRSSALIQCEFFLPRNEDLCWEQACKEQDNYNKAVDLAKSFLSQSEEEYQFMMKWIFGRPKPFCDFIFSLCIKNESRTNINS